MKKRTLIIAVSVLLIISMSLVGCGEGEDTASDNPSGEESSETISGELPDEVLDINGPMVIISTEGMGYVARSVEGTTPVFDEFPGNQITDHLVQGTTLTIGAKPYDDDWEFVKWTVNDEDYSTDEQTTVTADENLQIVAVFEFKE